MALINIFFAVDASEAIGTFLILASRAEIWIVFISMLLSKNSRHKGEA